MQTFPHMKELNFNLQSKIFNYGDGLVRGGEAIHPKKPYFNHELLLDKEIGTFMPFGMLSKSGEQLPYIVWENEKGRPVVSVNITDRLNPKIARILPKLDTIRQAILISTVQILFKPYSTWTRLK